MSAKVHVWNGITDKGNRVISHSGPLGALGTRYRFVSSEGKELSPSTVASGEVHAVPVPSGIEAAVAVAVVTAIVTAALLPKPELPNAVGQSKTSPNNAPGRQSNVARLGQGKPDVRGEVKSKPDLIQAPWYYYEDNTQKVLQKFCVGVRSFSPNATIKIGETDIDNIAGAEYFWDGTGSLGDASDELGTYHDHYPIRNDGVEKLKVAAPDEISAGINYMRIDASANTISLKGQTRWGTSDGTDNFPAALEFSSTKSFAIDNIPTESPTPIELGYFEYSSYSVQTEDISLGGGLFEEVHVFVISNRTLSTSVKYDAQPDRFANVRRGDTSDDGWTEWQFVHQKNRAMVNLSWPQSIRNGSGDPTTMDWEIQLRAPDGFIASDSGTKEAFDNSPVYHSSFFFLAPTIEAFRVRRTTTYAAARSDLVIDSFFSLGTYVGDSIPGHGILSTTYRGGRYDTQPQTGNVSIIPVPEFYFYNGTSISLVTPGTTERSFANSVLTDLVLAYGTTDVDEIKAVADIDTLYDIASALSDDLRAFSFTFDDEDIDLEQRLTTACNAARVSTYREGGAYWRFTRDESKPVTAIFNRRNIAGSSENEFTYEGWKPLDKDGVSVRYVDRANDYREAYVYRSISGGSITTGQPARPLEIDLAGCDNTTQAENRADLEVRKLIYQRRKAKERVLSDGLNVAIGDRVRWAPIYDDALSHGEIMEVTDADTVTVSEPVSGTLYVHYTDGDGAVVGPVVCTGSGYTLTRTSGPTFADAVVADDDNQAGSMYVAGTTNALNYTDMTVTAVTPRADDTVDIEMIEYNELVFSED